MKSSIKIRKYTIHDFCDMAFIIICVFNTLYISFLNRVGNPVFVTVTILAVIFLSNFRNMLREIKVLDLLMYFFVFLLTVINYLIFDLDEMGDIIWKYLFITVPMMFAAVIIDFEKYDRFIYYVSVLYIVLNLIYIAGYYTNTISVALIAVDRIDYMGFAYNVLPAALIAGYKFLKNKKITTLIPFLLGVLTLVICGTRGPVVCVLAFLFLYFLADTRGRPSKKVLILMVLLIAAMIVLLNMRSIALAIYPIFEKYHLSTRLLTYFIVNDDIFNGSGREILYARVLKQVGDHVLLGSGLMSDRKLFGNYSHNFILEMLNSFGLPITVVLLILLVVLSIRAFRNVRSDTYKGYLIVFFSCSIIKLMLSSSFMLESALYIYLGLCLVCARRKGSGVA